MISSHTNKTGFLDHIISIYKRFNKIIKIVIPLKYLMQL